VLEIKEYRIITFSKEPSLGSQKKEWLRVYKLKRLPLYEWNIPKIYQPNLLFYGGQ
jgi:hypothetical protein